MNLEALLEPIPDRNQKEPCKVGRILNDLEGVYKTALSDLLEKPYSAGGLSDEALTDRLNRAGFSVGSTVVRRHRRKGCTCA